MRLDELKKLAQEQYERREYDAAIATCAMACALDPRDPAIFFRRGLARMAKWDPAGAGQDFARVLELIPPSDPRYDDSRFNRGLCVLRQGKYQEALPDFEYYLSKHPDDADSLLRRGQCRFRAGDNRGGLQDLDKAAELKPKMSEIFHHRALVHLALRQWRDAIADCDRALDLGGHTWCEAWFNRATAKAKVCDFWGALEDLDRYVAQFPNDADGYSVRGCRYLDVGLYERGLADFRRTLQMVPDRQKDLDYWLGIANKLDGALKRNDMTEYANACCDRGWQKYEDGDLVWSLMWFHRAVDASRTVARAWYGRGFVSSVLGKLTEAFDDASKTIEVDPTHASAWSLRGKCRRLAGNYKEALSDYNRSLELNPEELWSYYGRGLTRTELEDYQGAYDDLSRFIQKEPKDAEAWLGRGWAARRLGRNQDAIADYTRAIELYPEHSQAHVNRAYARKDVGDRNGAIADMRRAIELRPNDPQLKEALQDLLSAPAVAPVAPQPANPANPDLRRAAGNNVGMNGGSTNGVGARLAAHLKSMLPDGFPIPFSLMSGTIGPSQSMVEEREASFQLAVFIAYSIVQTCLRTIPDETRQQQIVGDFLSTALGDDMTRLLGEMQPIFAAYGDRTYNQSGNAFVDALTRAAQERIFRGQRDDAHLRSLQELYQMATAPVENILRG